MYLIIFFLVESCITLLSRDLKRNLFNLFASWSGIFAKPLGLANHISGTSAEEEKLQFCSLQAMSALLCCGPCFDPQYLSEDGLLYPWLDMLLSSKEDKVGVFFFCFFNILFIF